MARKITTEIFIKEMKEIHGDKYDYSKVEYKTCRDKICIICPEHGEFWQLPSNHRAGDGCPACRREKQKVKFEDFLKQAKEKFGDKFDYSKTKDSWNGSRSKVIIICPVHGDFEIEAYSFLHSEEGCPKCSRSKPKKPVIEGVKRKDMREYSIWRAMLTRISNPNTDDYSRYMGRGIKCCDRWRTSFENFYSDMGECPEGYSIDRIDPDGDYCPENCRWASAKTQAENRGDFNLIFTLNGETHVLKEWARIFNINYTTLHSRIYRYGLTFEEAIKEDPFNRLIEIDGEKKILKDWCDTYNIKYETVINRINKHKWSVEEAIKTPYKHKKVEIEVKDIV